MVTKLVDIKEKVVHLELGVLIAIVFRIWGIVIAGSAGTGKSTLARALCLFWNYRVPFLILNCVLPATHGIDQSPAMKVANSEIVRVLFDTEGQNLASLSHDYRILHLSSKLSSVQVQIMTDNIYENDIANLCLLGEEIRAKRVLINGQASTKVTLIICFRTNKQIARRTPNGPVICDVETWFNTDVVPQSHQLRTLFSEIHIIRFPVAPSEFLSKDNFQPQMVPEYWSAIQQLATTLDRIAVGLDARQLLSGEEMAILLQETADKLNTGQPINVLELHQMIILGRCQTYLKTSLTIFEESCAPYINNPFPYTEDVMQGLKTNAQNHFLNSLVVEQFSPDNIRFIEAEFTNRLMEVAESQRRKIETAKQQQTQALNRAKQDSELVFASIRERMNTELKGDPANVATVTQPLGTLLVKFDATTAACNCPSKQNVRSNLLVQRKELWALVNATNKQIHANQKEVLRVTAAPEVTCSVLVNATLGKGAHSYTYSVTLPGTVKDPNVISARYSIIAGIEGWIQFPTPGPVLPQFQQFSTPDAHANAYYDAANNQLNLQLGVSRGSQRAYIDRVDVFVTPNRLYGNEAGQVYRDPQCPAF